MAKMSDDSRPRHDLLLVVGGTCDLPPVVSSLFYLWSVGLSV